MHSISPARKCLCALTVMCAALACDSGGPEAGAGVLTAHVVSSGALDASVLIEFSDYVGRVEAGIGSVFTGPGEVNRRFLIVLPHPGEITLRVEVPDTTSPPAGVVLQAADGANTLRSALTGYALEWSR